VGTMYPWRGNRYSKEIHVNPNSIPSGIDRNEFANWRRHYWKDRGTAIAAGGG
jgi:hypothetical protein